MLDISSNHGSSVLQEHDYIGLSEVSSSAAPNPPPEEAEATLQETDLRLDLGLGLGLGSGFTRKEGEGDHKGNQHAGCSAAKKWMKRGFSETMAMPAPKNSEADAGLPKQSSFFSTWVPSKPTVPAWHSGGLDKPENLPPHKPFTPTENPQGPVPEDAPPAKDRVVGWPPVRSYRRQTLSKPAEMYVKVNMDGITVGRKVDLNAYTSYESLLRALEEMFQPSSSAQGAPQASLARDSDLKHFLLANGSDFVLTYEDRDGDWMLVGDVPWSMFVSTVRRLCITRGSEATGSGTIRF